MENCYSTSSSAFAPKKCSCSQKHFFFAFFRPFSLVLMCELVMGLIITAIFSVSLVNIRNVFLFHSKLRKKSFVGLIFEELLRLIIFRQQTLPSEKLCLARLSCKSSLENRTILPCVYAHYEYSAKLLEKQTKQ